jgi:hypothetical protein
MPYVDIVSMFEQVILPYTQAGATTTSNTAVAAKTLATWTAITLTDSTGFHAGDRVVLDVDGQQEIAIVPSITGDTIGVYISKAHSANGYPVTVEGGEAIVRQHLHRLDDIAAKMGEATAGAGVKQLDQGDVIFFESKGGGSAQFTDLQAQRDYWRDELASTIGVVNLRKMRRGNAGSSLEVY